MEITRVVHGRVLVGVLLLAARTAVAGPTPAQKCEQGKNKEAGKYAYCRQKVEAKFAITADGTLRTAGLDNCAAKYALKWPLLESKAVAAGGACPSVGDQTDIQQAIDLHTTDIATALASAVQTDGDVEDVIIARSLRTSRNTGASITAGCDASITGFNATLEDIFEMYSVKLSNQGIVKDDGWHKTGDLHVCLGPTAAGPAVLNFWTDGTLTGVSFHAIGTCTEQFRDFPEVGLRMFNCYQDLTNLSGGYIGGTLTTNTISSLQLFGEESNPPGYTQASIATVRLWKPRQ